MELKLQSYVGHAYLRMPHCNGSQSHTWLLRTIGQPLLVAQANELVQVQGDPLWDGRLTEGK